MHVHQPKGSHGNAIPTPLPMVSTAISLMKVQALQEVNGRLSVATCHAHGANEIAT